MRDDIMMQLVDRAMSDADFRQRAQQDPEAAVKAAGLDLTEEEMSAVKEFQQQTSGMSDEEVNRALAEGPRRQGG